MKAKPISIFCPFCNARGSEQPILSPMVASEVPLAPSEAARADRTPLLSYRCQRCGYGEIHAKGAA